MHFQSCGTVNRVTILTGARGRGRLRRSPGRRAQAAGGRCCLAAGRPAALACLSQRPLQTTRPATTSLHPPARTTCTRDAKPLQPQGLSLLSSTLHITSHGTDQHPFAGTPPSTAQTRAATPRALPTSSSWRPTPWPTPACWTAPSCAAAPSRRAGSWRGLVLQLLGWGCSGRGWRPLGWPCGGHCRRRASPG